MKLLGAAFAVETRKTAAARVTLATTTFLALGVVAIATGMTLAARSGNTEVIAKLGPAANLPGWEGLIAVVVQITAAAGVLAFGVVLSWIFGREFADGTVTGLFALPVPRSTIAAAKLLVYLLWALGVAVVIVVFVGLVGVVLNLDAPGSGIAPLLLRLATLTVLSALIATPTAWAATVGRGVLPGIATTIGIITVAQVMAVAGTGAWFPFTAPALWAIEPGAVTTAQLSLVALVPAAFGLLTLRAWCALQLDR
jgi:ABC-2 type transport system permease protein